MERPRLAAWMLLAGRHEWLITGPVLSETVQDNASIDPNTPPTITMIPKETATRWNIQATLARITDVDPIVSRYLGADLEERDAVAKEAEELVFSGTGSSQTQHPLSGARSSAAHAPNPLSVQTMARQVDDLGKAQLCWRTLVEAENVSI